MRSALALAVLGCLFSAPAHAEVVQADLTGHITDISTWDPTSKTSLHPSSFMGQSVGQTVEGLLRYDTSLTPTRSIIPGQGNLTAGPNGYGLALFARGMQLDPSGNLSLVPVPQQFPPGFPRGAGARIPPGLYVRNGLTDVLHPGLFTSLRVSLDARDPQARLFGPSVSALNVGLPGPAALASYSPQGNALAELMLTTSDGSTIYFEMPVDSIAVSQAPEPSALVLFGLGGLGLLGAARRRLAVGLLR